MRYLKTYEELNNISVEDFRKIKYWRYCHSKVNSIIKVEFNSDFNDDEYDFTLYDINKKKLSELKWLPVTFINGMIDLKDDNKVLRPATEEEIEEFKIVEKAKKYNL